MILIKCPVRASAVAVLGLAMTGVACRSARMSVEVALAPSHEKDLNSLLTAPAVP
jgi:hypothetical protein